MNRAEEIVLKMRRLSPKQRAELVSLVEREIRKIEEEEEKSV